MILRPTPSSPLLITQPDHAALAARIMREWSAGGLPESPRRSTILLAIEEHDNGWRAVDASPLIDRVTGQILDYIHAPDEVRQGVWPRGVSRLAGTPYAAALVAQHALHIYRRYRTDPAWAPFFAEMEAARDRHLSAVPSVGLGDLSTDYAFLRIGDLVSLTFCSAWTESQTDGYGYTVRVEDSHLIVSPDPFDGRSVPIEIAARTLDGLEPVTLKGVASGR